MRSNRSILKYFVTYESTVSCLKFDGSSGLSTLEKTKHGCWFLTEVLSKIIPNLDCIEQCQDYLKELGAKHQHYGVRREHLDLLALVYCAAVRGVVATQGNSPLISVITEPGLLLIFSIESVLIVFPTGVKGGPLSDTTRAWFCLLKFIVMNMKSGYVDEEDPSEPCDAEELVETHEHLATSECPHYEASPEMIRPGCSSRNSSLSSGNEDHFHVMKRRNAYIQMDTGSAVDSHEISGLLKSAPPGFNRSNRQSSLN